jgi:hypothetical protein
MEATKKPILDFGITHANTTESFWAIFKRGIKKT